MGNYDNSSWFCFQYYSLGGKTEKKLRFIICFILGIILLVSYLSIRNNQNDRVIIAFIDSACSKEKYREITNVLWENENEIPKNHIDDDKNGYVDDIYGWNFDKEKGKIFVENQHNHCDFVLHAFANMMSEKERNYEIMLLSVLNVEGECSIANLIRAIEYAEKNGADICNLSLTTYKNHKRLEETIEKSEMLFVAAAGNDGENLDEGFPSYPTNYKLDNVISVAATDDNHKLLEMSNYGINTVDAVMNGVIEVDGEVVEGTSIAAGKMSAVLTRLYCESERNKCLQKVCELL